MAEKEVRLYAFSKGTFQLFDHPEDNEITAMEVRRGRFYFFDTREGALAWIQDLPGAPTPRLQPPPLTPAEEADAEELLREIDAEFGPDGDSLA